MAREYKDFSSYFIGLIIGVMGLIILLIIVGESPAQLNKDIEELGGSICQENYGLEFQSYSTEEGLKCREKEISKEVVEEYDGIKVMVPKAPKIEGWRVDGDGCCFLTNNPEEIEYKDLMECERKNFCLRIISIENIEEEIIQLKSLSEKCNKNIECVTAVCHPKYKLCSYSEDDEISWKKGDLTYY